MPVFQYWPSNWTMSWQFIRLISEAHYGGGDFHELHSAARNVPDGDAEAWHREFYQLGERVAGLAEAEAAQGHRLTARAAHLRAANYFRTSEFYLLGDPRKVRAYQRSAAEFAKAAALFDPPCERVEVPYEGQSLPGWFMTAPGAAGGGKKPACLLVGGADTTAEELWVLGGREAVERGMHLLIVDGPGQGASVRLRGLYMRPDYEVPVIAMLDWLCARPEVDAKRIGLVGRSAGGYFGPKTAAVDGRIKAMVLWGACYDWLNDVYDFYPPIQPQFQYILGARDDADCRQKLKAYTLEGVLSKVRCPTLVSHGEQDRIVRPESARRTYSELASAEKELKMWTPETLGENHCQNDNTLNAVRFMYDWLADRV